MLDAHGSGGIFEVPPNASLRLVGVTLTGGVTSGDGGALLLLGGALTATRCRFIGNSAAAHGGAIAVRGGYATVAGSSF